jgi:hypothetical protein
MLRHDRQIFHKEYDSFTDAPVPALLSFVKFAKPIAKRSTKQALAMGPNCRAITDYFDYVQPELPPHVVAAILGTSGRRRRDPSQLEPD